MPRYSNKLVITNLDAEVVNEPVVSFFVELTLNYTELRARMHATYEAKGTKQRLTNLDSALNILLAKLQRTENNRVGPEMLGQFETTLADFSRQQKNLGVSARTIQDRRSMLRRWHEIAEICALEEKSSRNQTRFQLRVNQLLPEGTYHVASLAKDIGVSESTFRAWIKGAMPNTRSIAAIRRLETRFELPRDELTSLVPWGVNAIREKRNPQPARVIAYRERLAKLCKEPYSLREIPNRLVDEWTSYMDYKVTDLPVLLRQRRGQWWVRPIKDVANNLRKWHMMPSNNGVSTTAGINWILVKEFLGFLTLPSEKGGVGLGQEKLTLALFSHTNHILAFVKFKQNRSAGIIHDGIIKVLNLCTSLTHPTTGYLTQQPGKFAHLLDVPEADWVSHCTTAHKTLKQYCSELDSRKRKSRDPWDPIRHLTSLPNPIKPITLALQAFKRDIPTKIEGSISWAIAVRDLLLLQLLVVNPLRIQNIRMMTYHADQGGNLYKAQGGWRIQFPPDAFKNHAGAAKNKPYDAQVANWVWPTIELWLNDARPILEVNPSDFVFISSRASNQTSPWGNIHKVVENRTAQLLLPGPGFGPHSFRHLVATTWLKLQPGNYMIVAELLHDQLDTVIQNYAHLSVDDGSREWGKLIEDTLLN